MSDWWSRIRSQLRAAREIYEGIYVAPYRSQILREYRRERDLFLLVCFYAVLLVHTRVDGLSENCLIACA